MFSLHSYLPFLEGSGPTAHDLHTNHLNGTLAGDVTWQTKGILFGASVARVITPAALTFPAAAGSIEMLVKPTWNNADNIQHAFFDTYGGNNLRLLLRKSTSNLTEVFTAGNSRGTFTFAWVANTIYHVVLNWGTNKLYIDKVMVKDFTDGGLDLGASTLYIGDRESGLSAAFSGIIYYFISRSAPLTEAQIAIQYTLMKKFYP